MYEDIHLKPYVNNRTCGHYVKFANFMEGKMMLELFIFINAMLLIFLGGYIIKLMMARQDHMHHIDCGRALDQDGKPFVQQRPVIRL